MICTIDLDTLKYIYVSNACLKETGFTKEEHLQLSLKDVLPIEYQASVDQIITKAIDINKRLKRKYETSIELQRYHADGHLY